MMAIMFVCGWFPSSEFRLKHQLKQPKPLGSCLGFSKDLYKSAHPMNTLPLANRRCRSAMKTHFKSIIAR